AIGARDQLESLGCYRQGKSNGIRFIFGTHCPRRQDDDLISVGRDRGVDLCPADDNAVFPLLDNAHVIIRMFLSLWPQAAVAFHVTLSHGDAIIAVPAHLVVLLYPLLVLRLTPFGHFLSNNMECKKGIGTDFLN